MAAVNHFSLPNHSSLVYGRRRWLWIAETIRQLFRNL